MNEVIQRIENVVLDANCSRWEDIFVPHVEYFKKKIKNTEHVQNTHLPA